VENGARAASLVAKAGYSHQFVQDLADKSRFCTEWGLVTGPRRVARNHPATTPSKANPFRAQTAAEAGARAHAAHRRPAHAQRTDARAPGEPTPAPLGRGERWVAPSPR
jgi:hypothetical protein